MSYFLTLAARYMPYFSRACHPRHVLFSRACRPLHALLFPRLPPDTCLIFPRLPLATCLAFPALAARYMILFHSDWSIALFVTFDRLFIENCYPIKFYYSIQVEILINFFQVKMLREVNSKLVKNVAWNVCLNNLKKIQRYRFGYKTAKITTFKIEC